MITSLIEILQVPNFGHMTTSTVSFESRDKILLVTSWIEIMTSQLLFQNTLILRRPRVVNFTDVIKIKIKFMKTTYKDSKKVKRIKNYIIKCNIYLHFLM